MPSAGFFFAPRVPCRPLLLRPRYPAPSENPPRLGLLSSSIALVTVASMIQAPGPFDDPPPGPLDYVLGVVVCSAIGMTIMGALWLFGVIH